MKPKDNLERYFNRIFNSGIPAESWNDPGDATWNKIEHALDSQEKESSKLFFLPLIFGLLFFAGAAYLFFKVKEKDITIQQLNEKLKICASGQTYDSQSIQKEKETYQTIQNPETKDFYKHKSSINESISVDELPRFPLNVVYQEQKINPGETSMFSDSVITDRRENYKYISPSEIKSEPASLFTQIGADTAEIVPAAPSERVLQSKIQSDRTIDSVPEQEISIPAVNRMNLQIGLVATYQNDLLRRNPQLLIQEVNVNEFFTDSYSAGIQFRKSLTKKLMAGIGLHYSNRTLISNYQLKLTYDHNHEISLPEPSENIDYLMHHQLPSGQGNIDVEMLLSRNINHQVPDGEIIDMDFSIAGSSRILDFPLQLNYFPLESGKLFLSATLQPQVVIQRDLSVKQHNSHHQLVQEKHATAHFTDNNFRNLTLSAGLGVGFEQALSGKWIFNVQAGYMRAITYSYFNEANKLYSDRINASTALFYKF